MKITHVLLATFALTQATAQNTGVNTANPQAYLDINGGMALHMGVFNLPRAACANINAITNGNFVYRITCGTPLVKALVALQGVQLTVP